ncbi:hypothetical protein [Leptolyngbya sp. AN10]|uniref:hypothetical protein n=1 Tax=Leptolyngbya sp. AN10 TaxID=3423365 RepID=UPI003D318DF6
MTTTKTTNSNLELDIDNSIVVKIIERFPLLIEIEYERYSDEPRPILTYQDRIDRLSDTHPHLLHTLQTDEAYRKALAIAVKLSCNESVTIPVLTPEVEEFWQVSDCGGFLKRILIRGDTEKTEVKTVQEWEACVQLPEKILALINKKQDEFRTYV